MAASIRLAPRFQAPFDGVVVPLGEKSATRDALTPRLSGAAIPVAAWHSPGGHS